MKRRLRDLPYLTIAIGAVNVLVFLFMLVTDRVNGAGVYELGGVWYEAVAAGEWWRLLTACFLHFGVTHIGSNMLSLLAVGSVTERRGRRALWLIVYFVGGVGANVISMFVSHSNGEAALGAGASGCIFALVGLYISELLFDRGGFTAGKVLRPLAAVALMLVTGLEDPEIDLTAHIAGLVFGIVAGTLTGAFRRKEPSDGGYYV